MSPSQWTRNASTTKLSKAVLGFTVIARSIIAPAISSNRAKQKEFHAEFLFVKPLFCTGNCYNEVK